MIGEHLVVMLLIPFETLQILMVQQQHSVVLVLVEEYVALALEDFVVAARDVVVVSAYPWVVHRHLPRTENQVQGSEVVESSA